MYEHAVFIGRFQPFHSAHLAIVQSALRVAEKLTIVVGSDHQARTTKNPWTTAERVEMISLCLHGDERSRVTFVGVRDNLYNDNIWIADVQRSVAAVIGSSKSVALVGHRKDVSSSYLKMFPQWTFVDTNVDVPMNATQIRDLLFMSHIHSNAYWDGVKDKVPLPVFNYLNSFSDNDEYRVLCEEHTYIAKYKQMWAAAPFPPTFVTVDAVVLCSGHVLLVKRRTAPGKKLRAVPGGYLNQNETTVAGMVRELKEETKLRYARKDLEMRIVDSKVFDHPERSLRGRIITHAFCVNLGIGELPVVKGDSDAEKAYWMPIQQLYVHEHEFFEDHFSIVSYFVNRNG